MDGHIYSIVFQSRNLDYCAKYASKCELRLATLREMFASIVSGLVDDSTSLKAV